MQTPTTNTTPTAAPLTTYEYKILVATGPARLEEIVQQHMSFGWLPTGGFQVVESLAQPWCQSMYRIQSTSHLLQS